MADFSNTVVSVALLYAGTKEALPLEAVSSVLSAHFPYYELLVIANPVEEVTTLERTLLGFPNTRCIVLNNMASETVLREKAFEQCIGDQLVLFDPQEADPACIPVLLEANIKGNEFTGLTYCGTKNTLYGLASWCFSAFLRKLTGYSLNSALSATGCYSRTLLNTINAGSMGKSYLKLLLASVGFRNGTIAGAYRRRHGMGRLWRRLGESLDIIGSVPHRLLLLTAWLSLGCCLGNALYILYIIMVQFFVSFVQPGWTTASFTSSIFFGVLFFALFVFSCILANHLNHTNHTHFTIMRDISRSDCISSFNELNITDKP